MTGGVSTAASCSRALTRLLCISALLAAAIPLDAAVDSNETVRRLYQRALKMLADDGGSAALPRFQTIAARYPRMEWSALALWEIFNIEDVQGNAGAAFAALDALVTQHPGHFEKAHNAQLALVRRLVGLGKEQRRSLEPLRRSAVPDAGTLIEMLKTVSKNGPASETGIHAHYLLGIALEKTGDTAQAIAQHENFIEVHPRHELADDAAYQIAYICYKAWKLMRSTGPRQRDKAALSLADFLARFPDSAKAAQARYCLAEIRAAEQREMIELARYYEAKGDYKAAAVYRQELALKFPESVTEGNASQGPKTDGAIAPAVPSAALGETRAESRR